MLWSWLSFAAMVLTAVAGANSSIDTSAWENIHYYRNVELSRPYVVEYSLIDAKNLKTEPNDLYIFTVNDGFDAIPELAFISCTLTETKQELQPFKLAQGVYAIKFPYPIAPSSNVEFKIRYVYTNALAPFPEKIDMADRQHLLVKVNKFVYSPYATSDYSLVFTGFAKGQEMQLQNVTLTPDLPKLSGRVESEALVYGPTQAIIPSFSKVPLGLVYDHNKPITHVHNLERSFWLPGSGIDVVLTEEYYELSNSGAQLKNGFSRGDWMKGRYDFISEHFALSQLEFIEKEEAKFENYYITDKVGKVSSHHPAKGHIVLQPRYPLFGGWNYNFTFGWSNKLENFVHKSNDQDDVYIAKFPLLNGLREIYYDDVKLNFYLPEGAEFLSFNAPLLSDDVTVGAEASYLDVSDGHVKVTAHFRNLHDELNKLNVYIKYKYSPLSFRYKVLKIAGFVFVGLASYYALGALNLSIESN